MHCWLCHGWNCQASERFADWSMQQTRVAPGGLDIFCRRYRSPHLLRIFDASTNQAVRSMSSLSTHFRRWLSLLMHLSTGVLIQPASAAEPMPVSITSTNIHNLFQVTPRFFSGSQPVNDLAFAELAKVGIKTIVSVDGSKPDVEMARRHGL